MIDIGTMVLLTIEGKEVAGLVQGGDETSGEVLVEIILPREMQASLTRPMATLQSLGRISIRQAYEGALIEVLRTLQDQNTRLLLENARLSKLENIPKGNVGGWGS